MLTLTVYYRIEIKTLFNYNKLMHLSIPLIRPSAGTTSTSTNLIPILVKLNSLELSNTSFKLKLSNLKLATFSKTIN
jgi:hypothetical protein